MYKVATPGMGCGCGTPGCGCAGMGQSVSNVPSDLGSLIQDVFLNADGSLNMTAVAFAAIAGTLLVLNWGHTTRRRK